MRYTDLEPGIKVYRLETFTIDGVVLYNPTYDFVEKVIEGNGRVTVKFERTESIVNVKNDAPQTVFTNKKALYSYIDRLCLN